jgi:hypothetical protein
MKQVQHHASSFDDGNIWHVAWWFDGQSVMVARQMSDDHQCALIKNWWCRYSWGAESAGGQWSNSIVRQTVLMLKMCYTSWLFDGQSGWCWLPSMDRADMAEALKLATIWHHGYWIFGFSSSSKQWWEWCLSDACSDVKGVGVGGDVLVLSLLEPYLLHIYPHFICNDIIFEMSWEVKGLVVVWWCFGLQLEPFFDTLMIFLDLWVLGEEKFFFCKGVSVWHQYLN